MPRPLSRPGQIGVAAFAVLATTVQAPLPALSDTKVAERITAAQLKDYLTFIASDEMEGRDTPSRGLNTTAKFIATMLSRWGVKPGGDDGTYFQKIVLRSDKVDSAKSSVIIAGTTFAHGKDFLVPTAMGAGEGKVSAPLVYVGNGWLVKSKMIDDLKGLDVKGKIVLINGTNNQPPRGVSFRELPQDQRGKEWMDAVSYAKAQGAVGIIRIPSKSSLGSFANLGRFLEGGGMSMERFNEQPGGEKGLPTVIANSALITAIFAGEKSEATAILDGYSDNKPVAGFALTDAKNAEINTAIRIERVNTQNVIGIIEGRDKTLKAEYVGVSCHYDHVGMTASGIYNGADDNGTGTTALLSMVEAITSGKQRPKRSLIFIWHAGEEKGLWGSRYFTQWPTIPLDKLTALVNIDMIGRSKKPDDTNPRNRKLTLQNEIYVVGLTLMSTALEAVTRKSNDTYMKLKYNTELDDVKDPERIFTRSDHYLYAQKNVPAIFYFSGIHEDYHQMSDKVEKIDFVKMERITKTICHTLWEIAELRERPKFDRPLPREFGGR